MIELWMNNGLERIWKKAVEAKFTNVISWKLLGVTEKIHEQGNSGYSYPGLDLNPRSSKYDVHFREDS
jgi:hypothetical protein